MRKLYIVKEKKDFENIIKNGKCIKNKYYVIHHLNNNLKYDRNGLCTKRK